MATLSLHQATPRPTARLPLLSAGFRPFFLLAAAWAALGVPLWLAARAGAVEVPSALPASLWHAHEMLFGFAAAAIAGFLLTAIPNWTGRLPVRGAPLAVLALLWLAGRVALLFSAHLGAAWVTAMDLAFPVAFLAVIARELVAGRNYRNLPMLAALALLLAGNALVHLQALDLAYTAQAGLRLGLATVLMLIALVGGRIIPSFTRNWLARARPNGAMPAPFDALDRAALAGCAIALAAWVGFPDGAGTHALALGAGGMLAVRLARWRGIATVRNPLLFVLHAGYGWLALGLLLLGANGFFALLPPSAALHALSAGAVGTMTLAVMTRASLGHSGRPLAAGAATCAAYALVGLAALLRVAAPLAGAAGEALLLVSGAAWGGAFGVFVLGYGKLLIFGEKT